MEFRVVYRHAGITPRKTRYVVDMVRGQDVNKALEILAFTQKHGTVFVKKLLQSAIANATQSPGINVNKLYISEARVDGGPILPGRFQAGPMGRAMPVRRRTSHIHLTLQERGGAGIAKAGEKKHSEKTATAVASKEAGATKKTAVKKDTAKKKGKS